MDTTSLRAEKADAPPADERGRHVDWAALQARFAKQLLEPQGQRNARPPPYRGKPRPGAGQLYIKISREQMAAATATSLGGEDENVGGGPSLSKRQRVKDEEEPRLHDEVEEELEHVGERKRHRVQKDEGMDGKPASSVHAHARPYTTRSVAPLRLPAASPPPTPTTRAHHAAAHQHRSRAEREPEGKAEETDALAPAQEADALPAPAPSS